MEARRLLWVPGHSDKSSWSDTGKVSHFTLHLTFPQIYYLQYVLCRSLRCVGKVEFIVVFLQDECTSQFI